MKTLTDNEFYNIVNQIDRDTSIPLFRDEYEIEFLMRDGVYGVDLDMMFKKIKEIDYMTFVLRFGDDSKLWGPDGEYDLTPFQKGYLKCLLETVCYNDERIEI